jgi:hypothetical protein
MRGKRTYAYNFGILEIITAGIMQKTGSRRASRRSYAVPQERKLI